MLLTSQVAALLLLTPTLIAAAPAAAPAGAVEVSGIEAVSEIAYTKRDDASTLFERAPTCNAPIPTDPAARKKYDENMSKMSAATKKAHEGENMCKPGDFLKSKNKQEKQRIKDKCVNGYNQCVDERKKANNACKAAGGTVDQGHKDALKHCQDKLKEWKNKKVA